MKMFIVTLCTLVVNRFNITVAGHGNPIDDTPNEMRQCSDMITYQ